MKKWVIAFLVVCNFYTSTCYAAPVIIAATAASSGAAAARRAREANNSNSDQDLESENYKVYSINSYSNDVLFYDKNKHDFFKCSISSFSDSRKRDCSENGGFMQMSCSDWDKEYGRCNKAMTEVFGELR